MMPRTYSSSQRERGAATLVVVMVLFLVMALLAAYANRSLLFEQRISGNFFRASASLEASEAGIEWTLAQLNGTAVDGACKPVATAGRRFADRYLAIDHTDRSIYPTADDDKKYIADCARDVTSDSWICRCPDATAAHTPRSAIVGGEQSPSFGVNIKGGQRGGTLLLTIDACTTSVVDDCQRNSANLSKEQLSKIQVLASVGLVSAVRSPPAMPLVVRGGVQSTGAGRLGLHNTDARSNGMLAAVGGSWTGMVDGRLESVPGTSVGQTVAQTDSTLQSTADAEAVFKMFMGASSTKYQEHPSLRRLSCDGDCAGAIDTAYRAGQRIFWVEGSLSIGSNMVLGSINDPLLIVASGDVTLDGPFQLNGMLVSMRDVSWTNASSAPSVINGIVLVGRDMVTDGRMDIVYQQTVANQLRNRMGSYVRVPGGWIDNL